MAKRDAKIPDKIPQPHGGALLSGGKPGHRGGSGRPTSIIRDICSLRFEERVPLLARIADGDAPVIPRCPECGYQNERAETAGTTPETRDRLRAIDMLARYGLGERSELSSDVVAANVDRMLQTAQALMTPDDFAAYVKQSSTIWND